MTKENEREYGHMDGQSYEKQSDLWHAREKDSGGIIGESKGTVESLHLFLPL